MGEWNPDYDTVVLWDPGPQAVVWVLYQRDDAHLTARFAGWDVPHDGQALEQQIDLEALMDVFSFTGSFGFTTMPQFADIDLP